jgi:hypothetical protein
MAVFNGMRPGEILAIRIGYSEPFVSSPSRLVLRQTWRIGSAGLANSRRTLFCSPSKNLRTPVLRDNLW